jgi:hypothetical protein
MESEELSNESDGSEKVVNKSLEKKKKTKKKKNVLNDWGN